MSKCPYCQNEMKNGFVECDGRRGLLWTSEIVNKGSLFRTLSEDINYENSCIQINPGKLGLYRTEADYCEFCKKITIDIIK